MEEKVHIYGNPLSHYDSSPYLSRRWWWRVIPTSWHGWIQGSWSFRWWLGWWLLLRVPEYGATSRRCRRTEELRWCWWRVKGRRGNSRWGSKVRRGLDRVKHAGWSRGSNWSVWYIAAQSSTSQPCRGKAGSAFYPVMEGKNRSLCFTLIIK